MWLFFWKILFALLLNVLLLLLVHHFVFAAVIINEVHPAPSSGNDWVELTNTGADSVSLANWTLEDSSSAMPTTPSLSTITIESHAYVVIEVSNRLNNTGDSVFLKNAVGQIIDQFIYTSSQSNLSWSRIPDGTGNFVLGQPTRAASNSNTTSPSPTDSPLPTPSPTNEPSPTPTPSQSPTPTPSPSPDPTPQTYPTSFQLSEIMACPETDQKEWVELYNPDPTAYQLTNWKLKDSTGNTRLINGQLNAQSYGAFDLSSSMFNNTGDSISLETPNGLQIFSAQFGACQKGRSFVFYDEDWQETTLITKGVSNIYASPDASQEVSQTTPVVTTAILNNLAALSNSPDSTASTLLALSDSATVAAEFYPLVDSDVTQIHSATTAAEFGDSLTPQEKTAPTNQANFISAINQHLPTWLLPILVVASLILLLSGGVGLYQWYTEQHVQEEDSGIP